MARSRQVARGGERCISGWALPVSIRDAEAIALQGAAGSSCRRLSPAMLAGGFFGFGGNKAMDEVKRKQTAEVAYQKGVKAINKYIELGNDGLGLNFTPVDTID